ncbi:MAG: ABC transporter permease [Burkholderiaceae bacterium]|nr:MAG: ABC transporter permease [Burkholderiaceae bacterium]
MLFLAFRNLSRQWVRSGMTLAAIAFGVAGLILTGGFIRDVYHQLAEALIHSQTGHFQIARDGYFHLGSQSPEKYLIKNPELLAARVRQVPDVVDVMARLDFSGLLNNGETDLSVRVEGIEPERENRLGSYVRMVAGTQLPVGDPHGVLLGKGVADRLKLKSGDPVTLVTNTPEGALNTIELTVRGVFVSAAKDYDDRIVRIPLPAAQEVLTVAGATRLVVLLQQREQTDSAVVATRALLAGNGAQPMEISTWIQLNDFYTKTVNMYDHQFAVLQIVILVMVMLSVANAVNMSIFERTGEFGTMRALGNRSHYISRLVMLENCLLGATGALIGVVLGLALAVLISWIGIDMPPPPNMSQGYTAAIRVTPGILGSAFLIGVCATVVACVWPALKVSKKPIVDALRQNI